MEGGCTLGIPRPSQAKQFSESPRRLVKMQITGPALRSSDSEGLGRPWDFVFLRSSSVMLRFRGPQSELHGQGWLCPQGTDGSIWRHFWFSWVEGCYQHPEGGEVREAAKHPPLRGTTPRTRDSAAAHVNSAEIGKACVEERSTGSYTEAPETWFLLLSKFFSESGGKSSIFPVNICYQQSKIWWRWSFNYFGGVRWVLWKIMSWLLGCCSVDKSCQPLCDPMDCSTPGLPVLHCLPEVWSNSCPLRRWCHPTISSSVIPFSSCLQSFPASGSLPMTHLLTSGGQSIGASAQALVLPMNNIQDWFPLGWTGWIMTYKPQSFFPSLPWFYPPPSVPGYFK